MEDILKNLNPQQKEAVTTIHGPLLILAGPGSGKTRVLTHRLAYLIANNVIPENILAVTFTNKAAEEMKQRILKLIGKKIFAPVIGTFHSICLRILKKEIDKIGYRRSFTIYDEDDQLSVIKKIIIELEINKDQFPPKKVSAIISALKSEFINYSIYAENAREYFEKTMSTIYSAYQQELKKNNALDFDDLIMLTIELFEKFPEVLNFYQEKFRYILVDEYQDTDPIQYRLIKLLAAKYRNICVVGDDAQAIYSFRNADFRNILNFEKDYPEAKVITLDQNYRSTQNILDAASQIISRNKYQKPKNLWTENPAGPPISIISTWDEKSEAELITEKIKELKKQGFKLNDFTVFYRTNAQSRAIEETFIRNHIPYKLIGATKFYQRKEIKDLVSYLKFIATGDLISLGRIINTPPRGIGDVTFEKIKRAGIEKAGEEKKEIKNFYTLIEKLTGESKKLLLSQLLKSVLNEIDYREYLKKAYGGNILANDIPEDEARWQNIQELVNVCSDYDKIEPPQGLEEFLEKTALFSEADEINENQDLVHLMTLHTAKGLEFPVVFISGCEEGILPHSRSLINPLDIEEERRLFYVGITRSKGHLFCIFAQRRSSWGQKEANAPSRFLGEIPEQLINFEEFYKREGGDLIDF
jgi:DNA helicase-2/ATP-dependent DNA helicase PcrA